MYLESYKKLIVWRKSIELVKEIYNLTNSFLKSETYALADQMRRAAVSIPSNIAEGQSRKNLKEYLQFLSIAYGSAAELETQIIIAKDLYQSIDYAKAELLLEEVLKMLNVLMQKLDSKKPNT